MIALNANTQMFIEPFWQESLSSLLIAINMAYGAPHLRTILQPFTEADVVLIAQALENRSYKPEQWFGRSGSALPEPAKLSATAPAVHGTGRYTMLAYLAEPSGREAVSSRSAGLLYEDPFYAVLAAYNLGLAMAHGAAPGGSFPVEVMTSSRERAWAQRQPIVDQIRSATYRPQAYFAISGPLLPTTPQGRWRVGDVDGEDLTRLVFNGGAGAAFGSDRQQFHRLYKFVPP